MSQEQSNRVQKRQYHPALDGVRGLAILLVLLLHNFGFIGKFVFLGQLGVDLFFVLSGFLITDIVLNSLGKKNYLKNFYVRRVLRIFPLYYLFLLFFLLILPELSGSIDIKYYTDNQVFLWTYMQNWLYVFKDPGSNGLLLHLWSLSVEEQFYLLWPLAILLLKNAKRALLFIIIALLVYTVIKLYIWEHPVSPIANFDFFVYTRIDGVCVGCAVALLRQIKPGLIRKNSWAILASLLVINLVFILINSFSVLSYQYMTLMGYTSFSIIFGLLIDKVVSSDPKNSNHILNFKPLRFLGRISYGIYVYHLPVYLIMLSFFFPKLKTAMPEGIANLVISVCSIIIILLIAWLSFNFFEKYFLNLKKKFA